MRELFGVREPTSQTSCNYNSVFAVEARGRKVSPEPPDRTRTRTRMAVDQKTLRARSIVLRAWSDGRTGTGQIFAGRAGGVVSSDDRTTVKTGALVCLCSD